MGSFAFDSEGRGIALWLGGLSTLVKEKTLQWCVGRMFWSGEAAKKIEAVYQSQCGVACSWDRIIRSYGVAKLKRSKESADMYTAVAVDGFCGIRATIDVILTGGVGVRAPNARGSRSRRGAASQVHVG